MEQKTKFVSDVAEVSAQGLPLHSMWHLMPQVALCFSDVSLFGMSFRMPQWVDNFELRLCTRSPKPTSQGSSRLALSRQFPSILLCRRHISSVGPILVPGMVLQSKRPPVELVGLSTSPQGVQSIPELFLAGLVWRYCPIFKVSA